MAQGARQLPDAFFIALQWLTRIKNFDILVLLISNTK